MGDDASGSLAGGFIGGAFDVSPQSGNDVVDGLQPFGNVECRFLGFRDDAAELAAHHGAELVLEQNPWHRDAATLGIRRIEIPYITSDSRAELNLFLDGRIALANVGGDALGQVLAERLRLRQFRDGYVWFLGCLLYTSPSPRD